MINGNEISIDSLKVRIPLSKCDILMPELTQKYVLIGDEFGDIDESYTKKYSYRVEAPHYSTKYFIQTQGNERREQEQYIVIHLTAKILESRYFEGITEGNIRLVYDSLIKHKVVLFTYQDFLESSGGTDIDFKYDFSYMEGQKGEPIPLFKEFTMQLWSITQSKYKEIAKRFPIKKEAGITSQGIQWNNRTSATERKPFVKFYNKQLHIQKDDGMKGFAEAYLTKEQAEAVKFRVEVTVKNKKAIKWHKIKGNTLKELLSLTPKQKLHILTKSIKVYLVDTNPKPVKPLDKKEVWHIKVITRLMEMLIEKKQPYAYIMNYCIMDLDKHQKCRYKPVLEDIYNKLIGDDKRKEPSLEVMGWFNMLGLIK